MADVPDTGARADDGDIGPYDAPQAFSRPDYAADPYAPRPGEMRRRAVGPRAPCSRPPPARAARALQRFLLTRPDSRAQVEMGMSGITSDDFDECVFEVAMDTVRFDARPSDCRPPPQQLSRESLSETVSEPTAQITWIG